MESSGKCRCGTWTLWRKASLIKTGYEERDSWGKTLCLVLIVPYLRGEGGEWKWEQPPVHWFTKYTQRLGWGTIQTSPMNSRKVMTCTISCCLPGWALTGSWNREHSLNWVPDMLTQNVSVSRDALLLCQMFVPVYAFSYSRNACSLKLRSKIHKDIYNIKLFLILKLNF